MPGFADSVRHRPPPETSWWAQPDLSRAAWTALQELAQRRMNVSGKDLKPYSTPKKPSAQYDGAA